MDSENERIGTFLRICTQLVDGKFLVAENKVSEALAAIAASRRLTELFTAVAQDFDYPTAKKAYLRAPSRDGWNRGRAYLPVERSEILAFVFCLFVEIDAGSISLNDFLLKYFYVDGSYTASYMVFAERVVKPFRDIVCDCFPEAAKGGRTGADPQGERIAGIAALLPAEKARVEKMNLREEERAAAELIFSGLMSAAEKKDVGLLSGQLAGYRYFLHYIGGESESSAAVFRLAGEL